MARDLTAYRRFIDEEMLVLLGQLDLPSQINEWLFLGSEWNASDVQVLERIGVTHVVNVSREIDNFFPNRFHYYNVRVYDDESSELLRYWNSVFKFIENAKQVNGRVLVHCKMGVSRSAACVVAYVMKSQHLCRDEAVEFVRQKRTCVQPNKGFMEQLLVYEGILKASRVRHSDLFRMPSFTGDGRPNSMVEIQRRGSAMASLNSLNNRSLPCNVGSRIAAFEQSQQQKLADRRQRNKTQPLNLLDDDSNGSMLRLHQQHCDAMLRHSSDNVSSSIIEQTVGVNGETAVEPTTQLGIVRRIRSQLDVKTRASVI